MWLRKSALALFFSVITFNVFFTAYDCFPASNSEQVINLLKNPGFETLTDTMPSQWETNAWITDENVTRFHISNDHPHSGNFYVVIENYGENDSRFIQRVEVKPDTVYRISGWIKTENVGTAHTGANITILQDYYIDHSDDVTGTSDWQYVEFYILTKKDQRDLLVAARLGGFGEVNTGKACFDDLEFSEVGALPNDAELSSSMLAGKFISNLASETGGREHVVHREKETTEEEEPQPPGKQVTLTALPFSITFMFAVAFLLLAGAMYYFFFKRENLIKAEDKTLRNVLIVLLVAALVARMIIAFTFEGYHNDTESFKAWAVRSSTHPFNEFYVKELFADYPPGYIYVLALIGNFGKLISLDYDSALYIMLLKLPGILADIVTAYVIFVIARKKLNAKTAFALGILYAFNPALLFTSSFWGQMDSIPALLVLLIILCILDDRLWLAGLILGITILIKLQTGVLFFILLFALIAKKDWKSWVLTPIAGLGVFFLIIIPFIPKGSNVLWIFEIMTRTMTQYPYASVNAFNLMGLFGGNCHVGLHIRGPHFRLRDDSLFQDEGQGEKLLRYTRVLRFGIHAHASDARAIRVHRDYRLAHVFHLHEPEGSPLPLRRFLRYLLHQHRLRARLFSARHVHLRRGSGRDHHFDSQCRNVRVPH
jgi:dolichyl-phosphate-mannose-protein mannosyltransferase